MTSIRYQSLGHVLDLELFLYSKLFYRVIVRMTVNFVHSDVREELQEIDGNPSNSQELHTSFGK